MRLSKKAVVVLVIIAVVLVGFTVYTVASDSDSPVGTSGSSQPSEDNGRVGVTIVSPDVEDRLGGGTSG